MRKLLKQLDMNDILILLGMLMLAIGLALYSIALACSVTGALLAVVGLIGAWRKGVTS